MMSKNSKSVYKYISVIQCILTQCNIISIEIPKIVSPINFHHCRRFQVINISLLVSRDRKTEMPGC